MHYKADGVYCFVRVVLWIFDTDTGQALDLFQCNAELLLSHCTKDEYQVSRQVMALHCLPWQSQMKCAASLSASVHRHGEVLKH